MYIEAQTVLKFILDIQLILNHSMLFKVVGCGDAMIKT